MVKGEPKSGWNYFLNELKDSGFYTIKNYNEIPKYSICSDGDYMFIERWKNGAYRKFEYSGFSMYTDEIKLAEMDVIRSILNLIVEQFNYSIRLSNR